MEIQRFLRRTWEKYYEYTYFTNLELDKAGSEEVTCWECWMPVSGRCIEDDNRYYHLSCSRVSSKMESLLLHFWSGHGDLIFAGELKNKAKEDAVCFGCEKPVVGPGYECSAPECKFLLHQSCAQLPLEMQHPSHSDHTLFFREPKPNYYCDACGKDCGGCFNYRCYQCDFDLDIPCATWTIKNRDDCHHEYRPIFMRSRFSCDACGEEDEGLARQCNICQLLIRGKCGQFSRIIRITAHRHCLFITYSLREVREVKAGKNIFCNLCYEKIKTKYGAYFCKKCNFVAHFKCAYEYFERVCEESDDLDSDDEEEIDEELIEGAEKIRHFSHHHILNLCKEELVDSKHCDACIGLISAPFYSCTVCNYFLHNGCVHLPRKKKHLLHKHKLTLTSQFPDDDLCFLCNACARPSQGFSYHCAECKFYLDIKCFSMPETLEYKGHPHSLFLAVLSEKKCKACDHNHIGKKGVFVCTECELVFCFKCVTFPFEAKYKSHKHSLKFIFVEETNSEDYYCLICEKKRDQKSWIHYCSECDFPTHTDCIIGRYPNIKFGRFYKSKYHQHPLAFVLGDEFSTCDVCGESFDDGIAVKCAECKICTCLEDECFATSGLLPEDEEDEENDLGAEEAGGTSAGTKGECDSVEENDSGSEDAGGTSIGTGGGHDSGKGVIFDKEIDSVDEVGSAEEIDSCAEEQRGLAQASEAVLEIDTVAEDEEGTTVGTRGGRDSGEGIDSGEDVDFGEIDLGEEIDSGAEEVGELPRAPEAGVIRLRRLIRVKRLSQVRRVIRVPRRQGN